MRSLLRRSVAKVAIGGSEAQLPLEVLSPPGAGTGLDVYRLRLGDHVFACGLLWAPETKLAGRAVVAAREVAREARTQRRAHEKKERSRRNRERPAGLDVEDDLSGTAQEVAAGAANDLVVVRPIAAELAHSEGHGEASSLPGALVAGDRGGGVEQYAFGSSARGHEPGDLSLAALVVERAGFSNAVFLLRVDGTDTPVYYYLVVHGGLIRSGSDRCFTDLKEAQLHLHQFVMMLRDTRVESSFHFVFSPGIDFGLVDCERRSIEEFLEGPVPFVLRPLFFRIGSRERRRLLVGAASLAAVGVIGWYGLEWLAKEDMRRRLAREAEEAARRAREARKRLVIDPVREAPWEAVVVRHASGFVREAVAAALGVPTFARGAAGAPGAYDLELVRVAVGRVSARYLVVTEPPQIDGAETPQWPVRVEREWDWAPSGDGDRAAEFSPVGLQSVLDGLREGATVSTVLRNALIGELRGVDRITHQVFRVLVHPGRTEIGKAESAGDVAWVAQYFEVRLRSRPDESGSLLRALDAARGLQVTEVRYLDDDREKWIVQGYVAGALDLLGETRTQEREMAAEGTIEG